ncbi:MAG: ExbD/TolR family protein [Spirochaetaceae bacterium]
MQFRRRLRPEAQVDLIPMIDVIFQLVVFFMVSSTFITTPGIALDLPSSSSSEPVTMNRLVVTVVNEEEIYLNRERHELDELEAVLTDFAEEIPEEEEAGGLRSVVIEADREVSYELMVTVLDRLRNNGFRAVNLSTLEDRDEQSE